MMAHLSEVCQEVSAEHLRRSQCVSATISAPLIFLLNQVIICAQCSEVRILIDHQTWEPNGDVWIEPTRDLHLSSSKSVLEVQEVCRALSKSYLAGILLCASPCCKDIELAHLFKDGQDSCEELMI